MLCIRGAETSHVALFRKLPCVRSIRANGHELLRGGKGEEREREREDEKFSKDDLIDISW